MDFGDLTSQLNHKRNLFTTSNHHGDRQPTLCETPEIDNGNESEALSQGAGSDITDSQRTNEDTGENHGAELDLFDEEVSQALVNFSALKDGSYGDHVSYISDDSDVEDDLEAGGDRDIDTNQFRNSTTDKLETFNRRKSTEVDKIKSNFDNENTNSSDLELIRHCTDIDESEIIKNCRRKSTEIDKNVEQKHTQNDMESTKYCETSEKAKEITNESNPESIRTAKNEEDLNKHSQCDENIEGTHKMTDEYNDQKREMEKVPDSVDEEMTQFLSLGSDFHEGEQKTLDTTQSEQNDQKIDASDIKNISDVDCIPESILDDDSNDLNSDKSKNSDVLHISKTSQESHDQSTENSDVLAIPETQCFDVSAENEKSQSDQENQTTVSDKDVKEKSNAEKQCDTAQGKKLDSSSAKGNISDGGPSNDKSQQGMDCDSSHLSVKSDSLPSKLRTEPAPSSGDNDDNECVIIDDDDEDDLDVTSDHGSENEAVYMNGDVTDEDDLLLSSSPHSQGNASDHVIMIGSSDDENDLDNHNDTYSADNEEDDVSWDSDETVDVSVNSINQNGISSSSDSRDSSGSSNSSSDCSIISYEYDSNADVYEHNSTVDSSELVSSDDENYQDKSGDHVIIIDDDDAEEEVDHDVGSQMQPNSDKDEEHIEINDPLKSSKVTPSTGEIDGNKNDPIQVNDTLNGEVLAQDVDVEANNDFREKDNGAPSNELVTPPGGSGENHNDQSVEKTDSSDANKPTDDQKTPDVDKTQMLTNGTHRSATDVSETNSGENNDSLTGEHVAQPSGVKRSYSSAFEENSL